MISSLNRNKLLLWSPFIGLCRVFVPRAASDQPRILLAPQSSLGFSTLPSIHLAVKSQGSPTVRHTMVVEEKEELGARERRQQTPLFPFLSLSLSPPTPPSPLFFFFTKLIQCEPVVLRVVCLNVTESYWAVKLFYPWGSKVGGPRKRYLPTLGLPVWCSLAQHQGYPRNSEGQKRS